MILTCVYILSLSLTHSIIHVSDLYDKRIITCSGLAWFIFNYPLNDYSDDARVRLDIHPPII